MNQDLSGSDRSLSLLGGAEADLQGERLFDGKKPGAALALTIKMVSPAIGLWPLLG
jgi:hypothetical protein